jgi:hypothetical protein
MGVLFDFDKVFGIQLRLFGLGCGFACCDSSWGILTGRS